MAKYINDDEFIEAWRRLGSAKKVAGFFKVDVRSAYARRRYVENKHGIALEAAVDPTGGSQTTKVGRRATELAVQRAKVYKREMPLSVDNGSVIIASDCHYWPGMVSVAHQALCKLIKAIKPKAVILNGDILDGARISRHPRIMWEKQPELKDEIHAVQDRCAEIERAAKGAKLIRTIGNHDARFENYLSARAGEFEEMTGMTLLDYLPRWEAGWAAHINSNTFGWTVVRHRPVSGGVHSAYNSALKSGVSYIHGHLHKLNVTPWGDYRGRRYGVDTGTLADPGGPQFNYTEAGPLNWCSGFAVLTYHDSKLLMPELCVVENGTAWFRGQKV